MRQRWTCPGHLCGDYQGYQRGCREAPCEAAQTRRRSEQRHREEPTSRRAPIDAAVKAAVLEALRERPSFAAAAQTVGISEFRLLRARRADPEWDARVLALLRPPPRRVNAQEAEQYLDQLRAGHTVLDAATRIGREYTSLYYLRLNDALFDRAVVDAAAEGRPPERAGRGPTYVHRINLEAQQ